MGSFLLCLCSLLLASFLSPANAGAPFGQNFKILYGEDHTLLSDQDTQIQLSIDEGTGSGFQSIKKFLSGIFTMSIKLPVNDPQAVVKTFYLISDSSDGRHEVDFEFLAKRDDGRYLLHTNIISLGNHHREQEFALWFDPTADFHNYTILWNQHLLALFVDFKPIRVLENTGVYKDMFLTKPMQIEATIWAADWASSKPVDWSGEPFSAQYKDFNINGCPYVNDASYSSCHSAGYPWNWKIFWTLNDKQKQVLDHVRKNYMVLDYCNYNNPPPECRK